MQLLLDGLRGNPRPARPPEWDLAIDLASQHHVLPFLAHILLQSGQELPPPIHARLLQAKREALHHAFVQTSELKQLLRAFALAQIPVLPLKGPSLAQRIYGASSLRISCDLDLLVPQTAFPSAVHLLTQLGFTPEALPDGYHQKFRRATAIVELHFNVEDPLAIDSDIPTVWRNARLADFQGQPAWLLAPADELRYLCLHGVRHRFDRLSLLLDIALAFQHLDPPPLTPRGTPNDLDRFLSLGHALVRRLYPDLPPRTNTPLTSMQTAKMDRLAARLWNDLLTTGPVQQDWRSLHRFYLETELTPARRLRRRIRHLRILLTRIIDDDARFAARLGLHRTWQIWLLRPLRLALSRRDVRP